MKQKEEITSPSAAPSIFAAPQQTTGSALTTITSNATVTQELASIYIAKQFPRDLALVTANMQAACSRTSLAEHATYSYPRGGTAVSGVSIRLAEALLSSWGNAASGWKEVARHYDAKKACMVSECIAFAFDKENNLRSEIAFTVPHIRNTRKGDIKLEDERDIYELCANMSARRRRACILQILPAWLVEEAMETVNATLERGDGKKPLPDLIRSMEAKFKALGVTRPQLEKNLGHPLEETTRQEVRNLGQSYNAIQDGQVRASDIFGVPSPEPVAPSIIPSQPTQDEIPGLGGQEIPQFGAAYHD